MKYRQRPADMEDLSLHQLFRQYRVPARADGRFIRRAKDAIVVCTPKMARDLESETFCQQQLNLHLPHRDPGDIIQDHGTYRAAFRAAVTAGRLDAEPSLADLVRAAQERGEAAEEENEEEREEPDDWMRICGVAIHDHDGPDTLTGDVPESDYDWGESGRRFTLLADAATFLQQQKQQYQPAEGAGSVPAGALLNPKQRQVMSIIS